ncbi:hypothetical protein [Streptomyces exfoliatus]|uniref:hypothetical protein n=1 Tax=Streptomyces exfoliatus TaxID=1905 RepID=UPI0037A4E9FC
MAGSSDPQQDVTYRAPVGCVDLRAFDNGNSYEIHACHDCLPWHAEVVVVEGESWSGSGMPSAVRSSRN